MSFKTIAVGDEVKLYNVDLTALSAAKTKAVTPNAGFAFRKPGTGVVNYSDGENISISATTKLSDGQKASDAVAFSNAGVQLITNKKPTDATINPSVNLALNLGSIKRVDKLVLNFYHEYNSMIGLPKDNKVMVYYSTDGFEYRRHGSYTINGTAAAGTTGVVETVIDLPDISAQYIKVSYDIGASPFAAPETKVVWEFTAMTEIGVVERASEVTYGAAPITDGETTNVALNKDWFGIDYNRKVAAYSGDFTDGVVVEGNDFSYGAPWFAFYRNGEYGNIDYSKKGDVIIDLGENGKNIGGVRLQAAPSIGEAESIKVYASNNASAWDEVGTITTSGTGIQWAGVDFAKTIDARYIKVSVVNKGMFFMVSEIEVLSYKLPDAASTGDLPANYEASLISVGKPYEIISDGGERDDGYKIDNVVLTNGAKHGGDIGGGYGLGVPYAEFVLDLGEKRTDLFRFAADLIGGGWGIAEPTGIRVAVSDDGENYFYVGASTTKVDNFFTVELDNTVGGRYVKFMCDATSHVWLSEIEVYAVVEVEDVSEDVSADVSDDSSAAASSEAETPPTGDMTLALVFVAIAAMSIGVVIKRRRA